MGTGKYGTADLRKRSLRVVEHSPHPIPSALPRTSYPHHGPSLLSHTFWGDPVLLFTNLIPWVSDGQKNVQSTVGYNPCVIFTGFHDSRVAPDGSRQPQRY